MTIPSNVTRNSYTGTGITGPYPVTFKFFENADLKVTVADTNGVETVKTLTTDYTVTGAGEQAGGSITFTTAVTNGYSIVIEPKADLTQDTDIKNEGGNLRESLEDRFDRLCRDDQVQQNSIDRSVKVQITDVSVADPVLPPREAGALIGWNDSGTGFANRAASLFSSDAAITSTGSTTARWISDRFAEAISVKDFSAVGDGVTDDTAAIQAAIDSGARRVTVPTGSYRVDGTISLRTGCALQLDGDLKRLSAYTASTRPVVLINNVQRATLTGSGAITMQNASPDGIVCIGPEDPTVSGNQTIDVEWCVIEKISLTGAGTGTGNLGVVLQCTAGWTGAKVCYQNWVNTLEINSVGHGVYVGSQANANVITDIMAWNIGVAGISLAGDDGNDGVHGAGVYPYSSITDMIVRGLFVSNSAGLTASLLARNASFNVAHGLHGEPGSGRLFSLDANCESNYISGIENHPQSGLDSGSNNTILTNATIRTNAPKFLAVLSSSAASATGDGTAATINFNSEIFDTYPGGSFSGGGFTAPITGKYRLSGTVYLTGIGAAHTTVIVTVATSNRSYIAYAETVSAQSKTSCAIPFSVLADMDAADTALIQVAVSGGAKTVNVYGDGSTATSFAGELSP